MTIRRSILFLLPAALAFAPASMSYAQGLADQTPEEIKEVRIEQNLGETIPLELTFADQDGNKVALGDYFKDGKPVILTPVYYNCPMLCTQVINGLVNGLKDVEWSVGEEFRIVTYSIDEREKPELAKPKQLGYINMYGRDDAEKGWDFLTGDKASVESLSNAVGFHYKRQPDGLIAHSASIMFLTPDGEISQYMNDVMFEPRDLRFALIEASEGSIGSPIEKFLLFTCYQFDTENNRYGMAAWKLMRSMAILTIVAIGVGLIFLFRRGSDADREHGGESLPAIERMH